MTAGTSCRRFLAAGDASTRPVQLMLLFTIASEIAVIFFEIGREVFEALLREVGAVNDELQFGKLCEQLVGQ